MEGEGRWCLPYRQNFLLIVCGSSGNFAQLYVVSKFLPERMAPLLDLLLVSFLQSTASTFILSHSFSSSEKKLTIDVCEWKHLSFVNELNTCADSTGIQCKVVEIV